MTLHLGYGTNGLTDLRLDDALGLLADLGYEGVGLTLDHMHLDPMAPDLAERTRRVRRYTSLGLRVTVETGARYVLDPRRKHGPSLLDPDPDARAARTALLVRAVDVAAELGAHAVHFFSGVIPPGTSTDTAWKRLTESIAPRPRSLRPLRHPPRHRARTRPPPRHPRRLPPPARPARRPGTARTHPRHRPLPVPGGGVTRGLRPRQCPLAPARPDRGHAARRPRAPPVRGRGDRLPARTRRPRRVGLPGPHRRRTAPPLPRPELARASIDFLRDAMTREPGRRAATTKGAAPC